MTSQEQVGQDPVMAQLQHCILSNMCKKLQSCPSLCTGTNRCVFTGSGSKILRPQLLKSDGCPVERVEARS